MTISFEVICSELTGESQIIPAFMLALLISMWVGDLFTGGICDMCIELRGYPFLHDEDKKPKKDKEKKDEKRKDNKHDKKRRSAKPAESVFVSSGCPCRGIWMCLHRTAVDRR